MGKKDKKKDKKKGKGAEKTAAKTEKKAAQKLKKELCEKGEEDIEQLIAKFGEEDRKRNEVIIEVTSPPSPRSSCSLCAHPEREDLFLFGGEYFNGSKTFMYNDLFVFNIKKNQWSIIHSPICPPPRCAHQAAVVPQGEGQMWIFGGEFASPTRAQFYHYKDLWVYHMNQQRWEQIKAPGGPSSRSGHRMIASGKMLMVFGGFHESFRDYKYYNDIYIFNLEDYQWSKLEPSGIAPTPRSACQVAPLPNGILIYGGYTKLKVKKEVDRGMIHSDMFGLQKEGDTTKWKWVPIRQSGVQPTSRCGFSIAVAPGSSRAYLFGGVHDEEEENEEMLTGMFYNDLYILELDKGRWLPVILHGKKEVGEKKRRRKQKEEKEDNEEINEINEEDGFQLEDLHLEEKEFVQKMDDGIFTVTIGPQTSSSEACNSLMSSESDEVASKALAFLPHSRMNASLVVKNSILYLYGGTYEKGDQQVTLSDFYSLDLHKSEEWKTIIPMDTSNQEWLESDESEGEEEEMDDHQTVEGAVGEEDSDDSEGTDDDTI